MTNQRVTANSPNGDKRDNSPNALPYCLLRAAIAGAQPDQLDNVSRQLWSIHGRGGVSDGEADSLSALIEERRRGKASAVGAVGQRLPSLSRYKPRRRQCSPDRAASRARRRSLSNGAPMPPALAAHFTEGERAVLAIVAGEVKRHGACDLPIDKIAALAGVGRTTVQNAAHEARRLGMIRITVRPRHGAKNLPNLVEIVSAEWRAWIRRGPAAHRPTGSKTVAASKIMSPTKSIEKGAFDESRSRCRGNPATGGVPGRGGTCSGAVGG